jgi:NAD(P)-dependent dehydrogenase (short-subunit alcohol dehydrogenase family)
VRYGYRRVHVLLQRDGWGPISSASMLGRGSGVIVNVASMAHKRGSPGAYVHYAAAKAAVLTMSSKHLRR